MKLRAHVEGLAITCIMAAVLAKDMLVKISANETVSKADADSFVVGRVVKPAKSINERGVIETRFKERIEIKTTVLLAAGDRVKLAAPDGVTGENTVAKWVSQTDVAAGDKPDSLFGLCWVGGAAGSVVEVLVY